MASPSLLTFDDYREARRLLSQPMDVPSGISGDWAIQRFRISKANAESFNFRQAINHEGRYVDPGRYVRLVRNKHTVVMSNTPAEQREHAEPVARAVDNVLVAGLGLGMVVQAILAKPSVKHVTVVEISPDVIKLAASYYLKRFGAERLTVVEGDIFTWPIPRDSYWAMVWFDIWDTARPENGRQMGILKRRFGPYAGWRGCWSQQELRLRRY